MDLRWHDILFIDALFWNTFMNVVQVEEAAAGPSGLQV